MRKTIKRLGAVLLAMAMAVSVLCTGALAAETYSITVTNTTAGYTYQAYQIFAGTLGTKAENATETPLGITDWGSNLKSKESDLIAALQSDSTIGSDFTNVLNKNNSSSGATIEATSVEAAQNVAKVIKDYANDSNKAKAFAKIVATNVTGTAAGSADTVTNSNGYVISLNQAGYYIVKNTKAPENTTGTAYSNYILKVVGNEEVKPKSSIPTVDKKIVENTTGKTETTAKVGDVVNFELTGTLPANYADYSAYKYEFHDTLSKGLTYNGDVKVYVKNGDSAEAEVEINGYTVDPANKTTTTPAIDTAITVKFENLNADTVKAKNTNQSVTIDKNSKIIVKYSATLNENAVVGGTGNKNTVNIVYSNDPNRNSTGTTTNKDVTVYTFQLNVNKVDGANNQTKLSGAEFKLYYEDGNTKYYATVNTTEGDNKNKITGWVTDAKQAIVLTTDADGNITVKGLKEGTYYLEEIEAPVGYNKLTAPVKVEIKNTNNDIKTLESVKADDTNGIVNGAEATISIANNKGSTLPSTGGMGTKLFYTIGGILMAGAAIVLVVRKRRSDAE